MRVSVLIAFISSVAIGALMMVIDSLLAEDASEHFNVVSVEVGAALSAFILAIATVFSVGRDNQGQIHLALGLVPRRGGSILHG